MADTKIYAGKAGIQELWRRVRDEIGKFTAFQKAEPAQDGTPDIALADRKTNIIYLVEEAGATPPDMCKEWIWTLPEEGEGEWVCIGDTSADLSDMARKSEMSVESVQGDTTKKTIQMKSGLSATVLVEHQDISGKQDKPSSSTAGDIATFDSGSSTVDSGKTFLNSTDTWDGTSDSFVPTTKSIQSKLDEKFGDLATVATTGSYEDLSNTPASTFAQDYLRTYDGHSIYSSRTDCDKDGNDLTLGIDGTTNTVTDSSGEPVQDTSGNPLADAESDARVVSIGELPIWADRAEKDASGNDIEATYATKQELQNALGDLEIILASI